jgi:hypothetical protein
LLWQPEMARAKASRMRSAESERRLADFNADLLMDFRAELRKKRRSWNERYHGLDAAAAAFC